MSESLTPESERITDFPKACAEKAAALKLSTPQLPFDSICMDGKPYKNYFDGKEQLFPSLVGEQAEYRLQHLGTWRQHQGVLEFIDAQGRYHVARAVDANRSALQRAGFTYTQDHSFFVNGTTPAGDYEVRYHTLLHTPENEHERLSWAAAASDHNQFTYALEHGATVEAARAYRNDPLIFDVIYARPSKEKDAIIRELITLEGPFARNVIGEPAFLHVDLRRPTARKDFKLIVDSMLKTKDLPEKEKKLIRGHQRVIDEGLATAAKETDPERKEAQTDKVFALAGKLRQAWQEAYRVESAEEQKSATTLSPWVQSFLEPLVDGKRTSKFLETLAHYDMHKLRTSDELVREFTEHVVLPLCLLDYSRRLGIPLTDDTLGELAKKNGFSPADLTDKLIPVVRAELFKGRSLDRIIGLNEAWHDPLVAFPDALKPFKAAGEWYSLPGEKVLEVPGLPGVTIHALTSFKELVEEGKVMAHCVGNGGAATQCLAGKLHTFSIRKEGAEKPLSTLGCKWDGKKYEKFQNLGVKNAAPSEEAVQAEAWLKEQLESGQTKPSRRLGETEESRKTNRQSAILRAVGFDITPENINAAFAEFADNEKRRAREYNPKSQEEPATGMARPAPFSLISHNTRLITGGINTELQGHSFVAQDETELNGEPKRINTSFILLDEAGQPKRTNIALRHLPAEMWFEESGLRDRAMAVTFQPLIAQELEQREIRAEFAKAREDTAPRTDAKPERSTASAAMPPADIRWTARVGRRISRAVSALPASWQKISRTPDARGSSETLR